VITEYKIFPDDHDVQLCPKCRDPMSVSDVIPTMPTTGFDEDEVVYWCRSCGTEVKRVLERQRV
jgi:Zn finger protein HypA/HybF involved in hydrogenase expression